MEVHDGQGPCPKDLGLWGHLPAHYQKDLSSCSPAWTYVRQLVKKDRLDAELEQTKNVVSQCLGFQLGLIRRLLPWVIEKEKLKVCVYVCLSSVSKCHHSGV